MYGIWGLIKKPYWTSTSEAFYEEILKHISKNDDILEFGSSTGHISMRLAAEGHTVTILDDRPLIIEQAKRIYKFYRVKASFIVNDFFKYNILHDFIWNSGLVQCFNDGAKQKLIEHMRKISNRALLFYPDTDSKEKVWGANAQEHPGVGDSVEYSVKNVIDISGGYYNDIQYGRFPSAQIKMPFDMLWVYMEN